MKKATYKKIVPGFVIQLYNDDSECVEQSFTAGAEVDYEDIDGSPLTSIEVDTESEKYQPMNMIQPEQVGTNGVKFICPGCGETRLECCEDGAYKSEVLNIDSEGDFDFGEISVSGEVERFQCLNCGYVVGTIKGLGFDAIPITDHEEIVEWCKENCKQE